ncbi:C-C motif chemokine 4-like [Monodelphis domestica]|uniref:C-C motif chemokine n=1 Tax=Monodelphis domestica TaxID=13616 RepID=F7EV69_MONDO|nr:C-C motif chemokine 4-like [Monodelphis domestica]
MKLGTGQGTEGARELRTHKTEGFSSCLKLLPSTNIMTSSVVVLSVLVMAIAFCSQVSSLSVGGDIPTACCFSYTSWKIPQTRVVDYYETSSKCSKPAIIFITKKGLQACANPRDPWVQELIKSVETRKKKVKFVPSETPRNQGQESVSTMKMATSE